MLGSRGETPPDVVAGLGVLAELLKHIDPTLVGRLEELQAEERRIGEQRSALQVAQAEHLARFEQVEQRKAEIDAAAAVVAVREAECAKSAAETPRRLASLEDQRRALEAREAELTAEREKLAQSAREFADTCSAERAKIAAERQAVQEEIAKDRQQAETAAQEDLATHSANIRRMHEVGAAEFDRQKRELLQRETQVTEREQAIRDRAAQLRAALGE